jgi:cytochrome c oxidase subunit 3
MSAVLPRPATTAGTIPVGGVGRRSIGWWGLLTLIATEGALFAYLLFSYYYVFVQVGPSWLPEREPTLKLALPNTLILLASSGTVWWAERSVRRGRGVAGTLAFVLTFVLGAIFVAIQLAEWKSKPYTIHSNAYGSLYFTITGFHMAHVAAGLVALALLAVWSMLGYFDRERHVPVLIGAAYWHFVDVVWLLVFATFYLVPRLW